MGEVDVQQDLDAALDGAVNEDGSPASVQDPDIVQLLAYWREKCGGRRFPRRADIDPVDLRFMLDRIALVEVHDGPGRRYRLRLVGSWWRDQYGFEPTTLWLEDWPNPDQLKLVLASYEALLSRKRPTVLTRDHWLDDKLLRYEAVLLPLSEDGATVSMVVAGIGRN